jgi:Glycosyl hydrolase family 66
VWPGQRRNGINVQVIRSYSWAETEGLRGGYGFLTDYRSYPEAQARGRVATLAQTFGIKEFQFYDWFATYSKPTNGSSWPDPFKHEREIYLETILTYIDEIHRRGGRAWAYVQAVGADEADLADPSAGIYPLLDRDGKWYGHPPEDPSFWTYFLNAAWADRMTGIWGPPVKNLGFDGIHWDTLGRKAGDYASEVNGTHAFLRRAKGSLAALGLSQTLNFVDLAWWDPDLVASGLVAFPYAEVWTMTSERSYYAHMNDPALARMWGVMAFYPTVDNPEGWTDSEVMLARWAEAPKHRLMYLILGDYENRLVGPYFPDATPLSPSEKAQMAASLPVRWRR